MYKLFSYGNIIIFFERVYQKQLVILSDLSLTNSHFHYIFTFYDLASVTISIFSLLPLPEYN